MPCRWRSGSNLILPRSSLCTPPCRRHQLLHHPKLRPRHPVAPPAQALNPVPDAPQNLVSSSNDAAWHQPAQLVPAAVVVFLPRAPPPPAPTTIRASTHPPLSRLLHRSTSPAFPFFKTSTAPQHRPYKTPRRPGSCPCSRTRAPHSHPSTAPPTHAFSRMDSSRFHPT